MVTVMKGKGFEQVEHQNAKRWLVNSYRTVFGVWRQFDLDDAADFLNEKTHDLKLYSFDDLPKLDLMCVMADARRHPDCTKGNSRCR